MPILPPTLCRLATAALLLFLATAPARSQDWTTLSLGTTSDLNAIEKTSFSVRYIVGDGGFAAQSTDITQATWNTVNVGTTADLLAIHQPAFGQVWMSGDAGTCRRFVSPDWIGRNIPNGGEDFVIFSRSSGWSYAAGTGGSLYRSTDSGVSWNLQSSGTTNALRSGNGFVSSAAVCVGDNGTVLKTTNGGGLWTPKPSGTTADLYVYQDVANNHIVCAGEAGTIIRSTDSGETWTQIPSGTNANIYGMDTSGQSSFYVLAVGEGGTCLRSTDAGLTWCAIDTGTTADLYCCDMILNSTWVIAGANGLMRRTENAGGGCFDPTGVLESDLRSGFQLVGPWPQPLVDQGRFELQLERGQHLRADVVDVTGRQVKRLLDRPVTAGERVSLQLQTGAWSSGVYFLRVEGNSFTETRKVVVVR